MCTDDDITLAISVSELKNLNSSEVSLKADLQFTSLNAKSTSGIPLVIWPLLTTINAFSLGLLCTLNSLISYEHDTWVWELQLLNLTITCC